MKARSLYNGGFIPSILKQCQFRTPNQFYSMRDLRLPQPCCCCCCSCCCSCCSTAFCCCFWCCFCCCCCSTALLFLVLLLLLFLVLLLLLLLNNFVVVVLVVLLLLFLFNRIFWDVTLRFWFPTLRRNVVPPSSAVRKTKFSTSFHFLHLKSISFKAGTGKVITVLN